MHTLPDGQNHGDNAITWDQTRLRLLIAGLWGLFWLFSSVAVVLCPVLRKDRAVGPEQVIPILIQISGIWFPSLSCLVGFWFAPNHRQGKKVVTSDRALAAVIVTVAYLIFVFMILLIPLYWVSYPDTPDLPQDASLTERMAEAVKYALLLSPLPIAPINWLTGSKPDSKSK